MLIVDMIKFLSVKWIKNPLYSGDTQRDFIPLSQYSNLDALPEDVLLYYQHIGNGIH